MQRRDGLLRRRYASREWLAGRKAGMQVPGQGLLPGAGLTFDEKRHCQSREFAGSSFEIAHWSRGAKVDCAMRVSLRQSSYHTLTPLNTVNLTGYLRR